eukprot:CAMPEP_0172649386 /NCGR_PEP_ID=MMETSP1068-20121228/241755_1 /TAXON_ID=35684 /ORGANISM="Pseudopedinella elastica, Strain CCMP716" /LENGTH=951 /DNA_ID=CAMNT_0013463735 /DNA_START=322 /DNA_END=3177 /DNA_ORIENTATION=-
MSSEEGKEGDETISVHLRLKPTKKDSGFLAKDDLDQEVVRVSIPERGVTKETGYVNNSKTTYAFRFNNVLAMEASQADVFDEVGRKAVANVLEGVNSTIFAYGQTGSGKTFTITGGVDSYDQRGLIPRAISMIFAQFAENPNIQYSCHVSYLEIYNESGFDLLDPSHETKALEDLPKVTMMSDGEGNTILKNLSMHRANSEEDALNLLFLGDTNRAIAETPMNLASSRSHCLFTVFVEGKRLGSDTVRRAKLHMVDLAGSERTAKTGATGQTLREATYINSSLFYLEMVIVALHEKAIRKRDHIPYRNSMMTSVLKDSLGGNCKTVMVATVSVEAAQIEETISTCKFAQRVALIKNKASVNEDLDPTLMISRLRGELTAVREEVAFLKGESGEGEALTLDEVDKLRAAVEAFVDDPNPTSTLQMGKMTLTKLKDVFAMFKNLVLDARMGTGGGDGGGGGGGAEIAAELTSLKETLAQRNQEIAILVNMVKQAKAKGGGGGAGGAGGGVSSLVSSSRAVSGAPAAAEPKVAKAKGGGGGAGGGVSSARAVSGAPAAAEPKVEVTSEGEGGGASAHQSGSKGEEPPPSSSSPQARAAGVEAAAAPVAARPRAAPVVSGVALTSDAAVLEDAEKAFEYFRAIWPRSASAEENKRVLKEKYDLAKQLYDQVVSSRSSISYLKKHIEQLRRERALAREGLTSDEMGGEDDSADAAEADAMAKMDREKSAYAAACNRLRDEKSAIEHIQRIMTAVRGKLQSEFDEWYGQCLAVEARHKVRGRGGGGGGGGGDSSNGGLGSAASEGPSESKAPAPSLDSLGARGAKRLEGPCRGGESKGAMGGWYGQCLAVEARHKVRGRGGGGGGGGDSSNGGLGSAASEGPSESKAPAPSLDSLGARGAKPSEGGACRGGESKGAMGGGGGGCGESKGGESEEEEALRLAREELFIMRRKAAQQRT